MGKTEKRRYTNHTPFLFFARNTINIVLVCVNVNVNDVLLLTETDNLFWSLFGYHRYDAFEMETIMVRGDEKRKRFKKGVVDGLGIGPTVQSFVDE